MSLLSIIFLSIIQGITEFLPISSSAHIILFGKIFHQQQPDLIFNTAVHLGSLIALLLYFKTDLKQFIRPLLQQQSLKKKSPEQTIVLGVLLATIPVAITGFFFHGAIEYYLHAVWVIALSSAFFALLLGYAAFVSPQAKTIKSIGIPDMLKIGLAQCLALIPGTSRAGITITQGLFCGLNKKEASKFSLFLAIPVITLSSLFSIMQLVQQKTNLSYGHFILAASISGVTAYISIHYFLKLINKIGLLPFIIYRLLLACILLVYSYHWFTS